MKEDAALDSAACVDGEGERSTLPHDRALSLVSDSDRSVSVKRAYSSDEEESRPVKVARTVSPSGKTSPPSDSDFGNCVEAASQGECRAPCEPVAGCSKYNDEDELVQNASHDTPLFSVDSVKKPFVSGEQDVEEDSTIPVELMNLSDDVLLIIMSHLKPTDLLNLSLCCQRLSQVASDWSLWIDVNFRPHSLLESQLERFLPFLSETTERIATRGFVSSKPRPRWQTECLTSQFLQSVASGCPHLRSFIAEEHCVDAAKLKISAFPPSIEHLSLKRCEIINLPTDVSYFNNICRYLPHLKVLELSDCTWLPPHSIMALSKLPCLEELFLDGCVLIKDCIAYASLAFNLGFSKLKVLDLCRTGVSDSELHCLNRSNRLTHLFLEYPSSSYISNNNDEPGLPRACQPPGIISDLGLRSLVISDKPHVLYNNAEFGIASEEVHVLAPLKDRVSMCKLHTLVARNFNLVTDATLSELHFAQSLRHLDLSGTQITRRGAEVFRSSRPDVTLITSYDDELI